MENAADALKMAAAVLIFVAALASAFSFVSQAKSTADVVLYSTDKTNFYENIRTIDYPNGGRLVGIETVISTIYRSTKETFCVTIKDSAGNILTSTQNFSDGTNKYIFDLAEDNMTYTKIKERIDSFLKKYANTSTIFIETFSEVNYSGKYKEADDGSKVTITPGGTKIYVTYTIKE